MANGTGDSLTARGRARRDELLETSLRAFAAQGYRGASLAAIAHEVGISEPGLLHHFPSKPALLLAVLDYYDRKVGERMKQVATASNGSLASQLIDLAERHEDDPTFIRLFTVLSAESVDPHHPAHDWFLQRYRRVRAKFAAAIANEQASGRLSTDVAPEELARLLVAVLDGLELQHLLESGKLDIVTPLRRLLEAVRAAD